MRLVYLIAVLFKGQLCPGSLQSDQDSAKANDELIELSTVQPESLVVECK